MLATDFPNQSQPVGCVIEMHAPSPNLYITGNGEWGMGNGE